MLASTVSSRLTRLHVNMIKESIVSSARPFSGSDVYFRQALRELRSEGWTIRFLFFSGVFVLVRGPRSITSSHFVGEVFHAC